MKRTIISIVFLVLTLVCHAQRPVRVSGEYHYVVPENVSITEAKSIAIERSRLEAMAKEFGTYVSQTTTSTVKNIDGNSEADFFSIGGTESKGVWLGDTKEPKVEIIYENGMMVVEAKVEGRAREINNVDTDIAVTLLCNGEASERFVHGDHFSVHFKAAAKGYVAIFLRDETFKNVYCLLPYANEGGEARVVQGNSEYVFLSTEDPIYPFREETILVTDKVLEFNTVIIVFSKKPFTIPLFENGIFVPELPADKFLKWLRKNRMSDETMQVVDKTVEIREK